MWCIKFCRGWIGCMKGISIYLSIQSEGKRSIRNMLTDFEVSLMELDGKGIVFFSVLITNNENFESTVLCNNFINESLFLQLIAFRSKMRGLGQLL